MKGIILQHFEPMQSHADKYVDGADQKGALPWLVQKSSNNINQYAESLGAEYKMLSGEPFRPGLRAQCQKVAMLNEEYDEYDVVVMLDTDKFMVKGCTENVFEAKGVACFDEVHKNQTLHNFYKKFPTWANMETPIWSGACYVMDREMRQLLRSQFNNEMERMCRMVSPTIYVDEGIMHALAVKAGIRYMKCI